MNKILLVGAVTLGAIVVMKKRQKSITPSQTLSTTTSNQTANTIPLPIATVEPYVVGSTSYIGKQLLIFNNNKYVLEIGKDFISPPDANGFYVSAYMDGLTYRIRLYDKNKTYVAVIKEIYSTENLMSTLPTYNVFPAV